MFYDHLTEQYNALRAEQEAGSCVFHLLVGEDGTVLGRFNLVDLEDGTAELGYRVAQQVAGRGVATATVRELGRLAAAVRAAHAQGSDHLRQRRTDGRWPARGTRPQPGARRAPPVISQALA